MYGPRQSPIYVVSQTVHRLLNNEPPDVYDGGKQIRCFTYISDAIDGMICAEHQRRQLVKPLTLEVKAKTTIEEVINIYGSYINEDIDVNGIDTKNKIWFRISRYRHQGPG